MNKKITHEIKLEKSVKIILGVLAIGILLNVFNPKDFGIKNLLAGSIGSWNNPVYIFCKGGCIEK